MSFYEYFTIEDIIKNEIFTLGFMNASRKLYRIISRLTIISVKFVGILP